MIFMRFRGPQALRDTYKNQGEALPLAAIRWLATLRLLRIAHRLLGTCRLRLGWRVCVGVVAASIKCAEIISGIWVFGAKILPGQAGCLSAGGAGCQLRFTGDFGHFRGYF